MKRFTIGYYVRVVMPGRDATDAMHRVEHADPAFDMFNGNAGQTTPLVSDLPAERGGRQEGQVVRVQVLHASEEVPNAS